jgi:hypothetical protein
MMAIDALTDAEVMEEIRLLQDRFTDADFDALEAQLRLRAAVLGWTGDPLRQPPRSVLSAARVVKGGDK